MASLNISLPEKVDVQDPEAIQKLNSYLYKLSEEIRYMFGNLTPEDNYSSEAYVKFLQSAEAQAKMEVSLNQIELSYVTKDNVISSINLSSEGVKIKGNNIYLEGAITANVDSQGKPTFSVDEKGFIHASGGTFKGEISASKISGSEVTGTTISGGTVSGTRITGGTIQIGQRFSVDAQGNLVATNGKFTGDINGSTISGSHIYSSYFGTTADDFYITSNGDETVIGITGWTFEDEIMYSNWIGDVENPASNGDTAGLNGRTGNAGFRRLYLLDDWYIGQDGDMWDVTRTLKWLDNRISALEGGGGGCGDDSDDCSGDTCDSGGGSCDCIGDGCSGDQCVNTP